MILTAGELALLRRDVEAPLPDTCVVNRVSQVSNGAGGWTDESVVTATVACRVSPVGQREAQIAQAMDATADHVVTLPADTDVKQNDTITVDGKTLSVTGIRERVSEGIVLRVFVTEDQS